MKLVEMIEKEFRKILWIGLAISVSGIAVFSIFSTKDTLDRANTFIESHVVSLVAKEISIQNTSEIDSRIRQVYQSWKSTQGTDLKISIYVDGRLIAQAGPLKSFGYFSMSTSKSLTLASGHSVNYKAEIDLSSVVIFFVLTIFFVIVFLVLCFWQLKNRMRLSLKTVAKPLEERAAWILKKANSLPESLQDQTTFKQSEVQEIAALDESFSIFQNRMLDLEEKLRSKSFLEAKIILAEQVAHSLKGAISHLSLLSKNESAIESDLISIQQKLVNVSENLLQTEKPRSNLMSGRISIFNPIEAIRKIVDEKRLFSLDRNFQIDCGQDNFQIKGSLIDFEITVSDLLDNAIQATDDDGNILISAKTTNRQIEVSVKDDGKGIPADVIPQLMKPKASFGKIGGTGLGLSHAKQTVESFNGSIEIKSQVSLGTEVKLRIPLATQEKIISLSDGQTLVIVDDDQSIHDCWDLLVFKFKDRLNVRHFYSSNEFQKWMTTRSIQDEDIFFIFDYDLKERLTGLDLIKMYNLSHLSKLITGISKDPVVQSAANELQATVWDKNDFPDIRIDFKPQNTPHIAVNL